MKKLLILIATCSLLAVPATAVGSTPASAASASCKAQLKAVGATAFDGPSGLYTSFGACVSKAQHLTPSQRQNLLAAEKWCRTAQTTNPSAFNSQYGTNGKSGKHATAPTSGTASNAFGKCVSTRNHQP
jgi:hypothetical protein